MGSAGIKFQGGWGAVLWCMRLHVRLRVLMPATPPPQHTHKKSTRAEGTEERQAELAALLQQLQL